MLQVRHVLVATDFSDTSRAALAYGRALARSFGGTLTILHVVDISAKGIGDAGGRFDEVQHEAEEAGLAQADALLTPDDRRSLQGKAVARQSLEPAKAIVDYALDEGIDIIVMGTHGRTGMRHLMMGSVAEGVVRSAPCPVLVVKHAEQELPAPAAGR